MTELYLIRHGVAEERGEAWPDDAKRPLTQEGMAKLRRAARALERLDVALDVIVTSPLVRTRQTADIIAGGLESLTRTSSTAESLAPGGGFAAVMADLEKQAKRSRLAHRRPRAGDRRAGRAAHRLAPSDSVQERCDRPHRRREIARRTRRPPLVPDAEDSQEHSEVKGNAKCKLRNANSHSAIGILHF